MSTATISQTEEHAAGASFDVDDKWCTPCACGKRFTSTSPSRAQARQRKHAEDEAKKSGAAQPKAAATSSRARVCGCGCGEPLAPRAGGLFKSGHDARFKSMLTQAHSEDRPLPHPLTGQDEPALTIADWLDERRGGGTFWRDKVTAGHKPKPEPKPRPVRPANDAAAENVGAARAERVMNMLNNRRAVAQDVGIVTLRSGKQYGAKVIRRENEDALRVEFLDGPSRGTQVIVADHRFAKNQKR